MKRYLTLIAATAALGVAAAAYAGPGEPPGAQPSPADQPPATTAPSTDPSSPSDQPSSTEPQSTDSAAAQSSTAAGPARLAEASPSSMSMSEACTGFKTQKECAATVHASQNLSIPFADLKSKVIGGEKLGKAIKELKPDADAKAEARKAEHQARSDSSTPSG